MPLVRLRLVRLEQWVVVEYRNTLRSGFSIANQIKFDLRFIDFRLT